LKKLPLLVCGFIEPYGLGFEWDMWKEMIVISLQRHGLCYNELVLKKILIFLEYLIYILLL